MALNLFFQLPVQSIIYSGTGVRYIFLTIRLPEYCCFILKTAVLPDKLRRSGCSCIMDEPCSAPLVLVQFHEQLSC